MPGYGGRWRNTPTETGHISGSRLKRTPGLPVVNQDNMKIQVPDEIFSIQNGATVESNNVATFVKELVLNLPG